MNSTNTLEAAISYSKLGWRLLPVKRLDKKPPLLADFPQQATNDQKKLAQWFASQEANVAVLTGVGFIVIDLDGQQGELSWRELVEKYGGMPVTVEQKTPRGRHLFFRTPIGAKIQNSAGKLGPGVDVRAWHGYVLLSPSRRHDGAYSWVKGRSPFEVEMSELPAWLENLLANNGKTPQRQNAEVNKTELIHEGERNVKLTSVAGRLRRSGLNEYEMLHVLISYNVEHCSPPLDEKEVKRICSSVARYTVASEMSDAGNARVFVELFGKDFKYHVEARRWLHWNGIIWEYDTMAPRRAALETANWLAVSAMNQKDDHIRKAQLRWARTSESQQRLEAMLKIAEPMLSVHSSQLDTWDDLLPVRNGLVDLATGKLLPQDRQKFFTKGLPIDFIPTARAPKFEAFIDDITNGDKELAHFLQVALGYSLTGRTDEQTFFFCYGSGKNGKSTLFAALEAIFGSYFGKVPIESFLSSYSYGEAPTPSRMAMRGKRLIVSSEIPDGRHLNEQFIKDLTGGDTIAGRRLHGDVEEFKMKGKIWLYGNAKPTIEGGEAIWRRVKLIPFTKIFSQPRKLSEILSEFEAEKEGILAWLVLGAVLWYQHGLPDSSAVKRETEAYKSENDMLAEFLEANCESGLVYSAEKAKLYRAYKSHCEATGEKVKSLTWFVRQLSQRGYQVGGHGRTKIFGLRLSHQEG